MKIKFLYIQQKCLPIVDFMPTQLKLPPHEHRMS